MKTTSSSAGLGTPQCLPYKVVVRPEVTLAVLSLGRRQHGTLPNSICALRGVIEVECIDFEVGCEFISCFPPRFNNGLWAFLFMVDVLTLWEQPEALTELQT